MAIRIRIARGFWTGRWGRALLIALLVLSFVGAAVFGYIWFRFARLIDARLGGEIFENAARIYSAPTTLYVGEPASLAQITAQLHRFGYSSPEEEPSPYGWFQRSEKVIEIRPGERSSVGPAQAVRVEVEEGEVKNLVSLRTGRLLTLVLIEPAHVTNLFDRRRTKRRLVTYTDIPPGLVQAVLTAEDRRFFDHPGISVVDVARALWYDLGVWSGKRKGARVQGASTLTMQLARSFFLTRDLSWKRKATEALIAVQLERRFEKEKIFELYANEIYLGQRGSFSVHGFGEGAQAYFGKDISRLTLSESALLAGIIRGPNYYNPYRHPDRARRRRDHILNGMVTIGFITEEQAAQAREEELTIAPQNVEANDAPYFVDLVRDQLLGHFSEEQLISRSYRVHTSLDLGLQRAAAEAIREALPEVDAKIAERFGEREDPLPLPQVALIALDPHTGQVKALVGGRDYNQTQLNRAVAHRQPGSSFKPFVFAAAFATALETPESAVTPVTTIVDEPTTFFWEGEEYEPSNYGEKFYGVVTARDALIRSLNVATVKVAEMAGYDRVAALAVAAGLNPRLRPTPSVSLGAYDSTPLEVAAAYTLFANGGNRVSPTRIDTVLSSEDEVLLKTENRPVPVLDARVAYLVLDLLVDNMNRGTGAGSRARGFTAPAAGKTGTSRDGWFVGFTSNLLCAVWVGFDDYRDLGLSGNAAALPIWTAFMKRAVQLPTYRNPQTFIPPEGMVAVPLDPETLQTATADCPEVRTELFILGTEPRDLCPKHRPSLVRRVTRSLSRAIGIRSRPRSQEPVPDSPPEPETDPPAPVRPQPQTPRSLGGKQN